LAEISVAAEINPLETDGNGKLNVETFETARIPDSERVPPAVEFCEICEVS
jgi:hypothetical protein